MKVDVEKLIDQIRRHPEIYNPDHKDFSNEEIRDNIFNTLISKEMNGIKGEILHRKWDKVLNKYASFIRKLSNDDSSETVLERFMEWPWTKHMRIFKPYVRKQFQIPEFQSAIQIPEMDPNDLPDIPFLMPRSISLSVPALPRPEFSRVIPVPRPVFPHPLSMPRPEFAHPLPTPRREFAHPLLAMPRPELAHAASRVEFLSHSSRLGIDFSSSTGTPQLAHGTASIQLPSLMEHIYMASSSSMTAGGDGSADDFHDIAAMMGLDQTEDDDDADSAADSDESMDTDEATESGPSAAKKIRLEKKPDDAAREHGENGDGTDGDNVAGRDRRKNGTDFLPDLPQPKALAERSPSDFTAQEHIFLAWAKTMSTFTAKRQATIKMQINKIMSEAEFEDLDDEFFAANKPSRRPIYTSRQ